MKVLILLAVVSTALGALIWEDNFDTLDEGKWKHLITTYRGGNNEFQIYRNDRRNSFVQDGFLYIQPTLLKNEMSDAEIRSGYINIEYCNEGDCVSIGNPGGDCIQPVYSARLVSREGFGYSRVEVRAKLPRGDWLWPAIWMLPFENRYGGWPASGEIDIMESRGNRDLKTPSGVSLGVDTVGQTLHWGPRWPYNGYDHTHWEKKIASGDYSDDFHTYEVERRPDRVTFRIDGVETGAITPPAGGFWELGGFANDPGGRNKWEGADLIAPFEQKFSVLLNVAVGGTFFADDAINGAYPRPWNWYDGHPITDFYEADGLYMPTWDRVFQIDYVRVYD